METSFTKHYIHNEYGVNDIPPLRCQSTNMYNIHKTLQHNKPHLPFEAYFLINTLLL